MISWRKNHKAEMKKYQSIASSNIQECENYLSRMKSGTQLLKDDDLIRKAFALMNSAMIQQQNRPDKVRNIFYANSEDDKHPKKNIWHFFRIFCKNF